MRIDTISIQNFKGFEKRSFTFNPFFNVIVGINGSGKTSLIEALQVALNGWYQGIGLATSDRRDIRKSDIRLRSFVKGNAISLEQQFPVSVSVEGCINSENIEWRRAQGISGKASYGELTNKFIHKIIGAVRSGEDIVLPLIASYSVSRLWFIPKEEKRDVDVDDLSRLAGYKEWSNPKLIASRINEWIFSEEQKAYRRDVPVDEGGKLLKQAIILCLDGAKRIIYDIDLKQIVVLFEDGHAVPYSSLSDGQRSMLTLVADIARRIITLNPHLEDDVLVETPGVVLIDELDIHLHPAWQRRVIRDLKRTFPKIQFIVTTHSPQIIGEAKPEEIILLDFEEMVHPAQSFGMDSNWILKYLMGADDRDRPVKEAIKEIFDLIEDDDFDEAKVKIEALRRYIEGDHPDLAEASALVERYTRIGR